MSLQNRFLIVVLTLVTTAVLFLGVSTLFISNSLTTSALEKQAEEQLTSNAIATSERIKNYFELLESQVRELSNRVETQRMASDFMDAYALYSTERDPLLQSELQALVSYYEDDFATLYQERNQSNVPQLEQLYDVLPETALQLQYDFIAGSSYEIGSKDQLTSLANGTTYDAVHGRYHEDTRAFLKAFGYYDIFIVDAVSGNIVYSVYKELDYATSLKTGPYRQTGIGQAFSKAVKATSADQVFHSSIDNYLPSYEALAGFLSSPIFIDGQLQAVLIFQMPLDNVNQIATRGQDWAARGMGETGESYLLTSDNLMLTESRFYLEQKDAFLSSLRQTNSSEAGAIAAAGTTVGVLKNTSNAANQALAGRTGFTKVTDYRGEEVFSAYRPLNFGDEQLALLSEKDVDEALQSAVTLQQALAGSGVVILLIVLGVSAVIAVWVTKLTIGPIQRVGRMCSELTNGSGDLTVKLEMSGMKEIDDMLAPFNKFIEQVREIVSSLKDDALALATSAEELHSITDDSRSLSARQREQTESVAESVHQLSISIAEISERINENQNQSVKAKSGIQENLSKTDSAAERIRELITMTKRSESVIQSLKEEVGNVTDILNNITGIADQTNLLALNAAIEAARAGDAGRGFSVVADEVRALANRSQQSTGEIAGIIDNMNKSSDLSIQSMDGAAQSAEQGIALVDTVTRALTEVSAILEEFQTMAQMVASATEQQRAVSSSVSSSVGSISELSQQVELGAGQTAESAQELARIAARASQLAGRFKV